MLKHAQETSHLRCNWSCSVCNHQLSRYLIYCYIQKTSWLHTVLDSPHFFIADWEILLKWSPSMLNDSHAQQLSVYTWTKVSSVYIDIAHRTHYFQGCKNFIAANANRHGILFWTQSWLMVLLFNCLTIEVCYDFYRCCRLSSKGKTIEWCLTKMRSFGLIRSFIVETMWNRRQSCCPFLFPKLSYAYDNF